MAIPGLDEDYYECTKNTQSSGNSLLVGHSSSGCSTILSITNPNDIIKLIFYADKHRKLDKYAKDLLKKLADNPTFDLKQPIDKILTFIDINFKPEEDDQCKIGLGYSNDNYCQYSTAGSSKYKKDNVERFLNNMGDKPLNDANSEYCATLKLVQGNKICIKEIIDQYCNSSSTEYAHGLLCSDFDWRQFDTLEC